MWSDDGILNYLHVKHHTLVHDYVCVSILLLSVHISISYLHWAIQYLDFCTWYCKMHVCALTEIPTHATLWDFSFVSALMSLCMYVEFQIIILLRSALKCVTDGYLWCFKFYCNVCTTCLVSGSHVLYGISITNNHPSSRTLQLLWLIWHHLSCIVCSHSLKQKNMWLIVPKTQEYCM